MADDVSGTATTTAVPTEGSVTTGPATQQPDAAAATDTTKAADPAATEQKPADGETKPGEQKADGEKKEGDDKKPEDDKPIEYAEFKLPDGVKVDEEALGQFKAISQEAKIPQEVAQKYVDLYADKVKAVAEAPYKLWHDTQEKWVSEIKADPEVGGDKLKEATAAAAKALDHPALAIPGLREALIFTGAGNHPAVLKFFARVGKAVSAETMVVPGGAATAPKSAAELMFPTMTKQE